MLNYYSRGQGAGDIFFSKNINLMSNIYHFLNINAWKFLALHIAYFSDHFYIRNFHILFKNKIIEKYFQFQGSKIIIKTIKQQINNHWKYFVLNNKKNESIEYAKACTRI